MGAFFSSSSSEAKVTFSEFVKFSMALRTKRLNISFKNFREFFSSSSSEARVTFSEFVRFSRAFRKGQILLLSTHLMQHFVALS